MSLWNVQVQWAKGILCLLRHVAATVALINCVACSLMNVQKHPAHPSGRHHDGDLDLGLRDAWPFQHIALAAQVSLGLWQACGHAHPTTRVCLGR